ncbi:hypothetical protein LSH36_677g02018 [Paralvinella palmiformis]|uniref:Sulfotransferase domain-containing protein n=1 Tax=Paralvinella palmiformis TaxID=53620 RepID=A0AAD9J3T5_9ANNE|nr:hypothetical protein LSH36_677g02018 [Paralvinella palmiformis]
MLMYHSNVGDKPNKNVKYSLLVDGSIRDVTQEGRSIGFVCCSKCTRFKLIVVISLIIIGAVFVTYKLTISFRSSPVIESSAVSFTQSVNATEHFSDKIRYKHTKRHLPECIIIGIRKSGTRALLTYLNLHPHIRTATEEIHFFDNDDNYSRGLEWYRKKMPYSFPEEITIEKTPAYFSTRIVPDRVYHMNSSIKLLLIVREPYERTVSDYVQISMKKQAKNLPVYPFEQMVLKKNGEINMQYSPLVRSVYHMYMENWLRRFDLKQFHIINGDNLIKDPYSEIRLIEDFLGLSHRIKKKNFYFNESRGFFCIRNETRDKCLAASKGREHPLIDSYVRDKLKQFFRPFNERFFELIQRRFDWN